MRVCVCVRVCVCARCFEDCKKFVKCPPNDFLDETLTIINMSSESARKTSERFRSGRRAISPCSLRSPRALFEKPPRSGLLSLSSSSSREINLLRIEKEKEKFCDIFSSWIRDGRTREGTTRKYSVSFSSVLRAREREREREEIESRKEKSGSVSPFSRSLSISLSFSLARSRSAFPGVREREEE